MILADFSYYADECRLSTHSLLVESVRVIVRDPLIAIPGNPLDASSMVPFSFHVGLGDDLLDLLVVKYARGVRARTGIAATAELTYA